VKPASSINRHLERCGDAGHYCICYSPEMASPKSEGGGRRRRCEGSATADAAEFFMPLRGGHRSPNEAERLVGILSTSISL
jgi:hypothetical protein